MSDLAATVAALKPGMRVRATFRRTDQEDYAVEGTLIGTDTGALDIRLNDGNSIYIRYGGGGADLLPSGLVAVEVLTHEVLTPEFEVGAWYEHPDKPGWLWRRYDGRFCLTGVGNVWDRSADMDEWRAGLRRVTLPSEQQEQP